MVVCVLLERISLLAALGSREEMFGAPLALAPPPGAEQRVGDVSPPAEAFGIAPGMRVGEALARCPGLRLVTPDPEAAVSRWNAMLDRVERVGARVESDRPGAAFFDTEGLERLHGGLDGVLAAARRVLPAGIRMGAAPSRFAARAAAGRSRRSPVVVRPAEVERFLAPLPVALLGARPGLEGMPETLERLGIRTLGHVAALAPAMLAERFGHPGLHAFELAHGRDTRLEPRRPPEPVTERVDLPDAATGPQLERALELLVARLLARRERRGRMLRGVVLSAFFAEGGSWRHGVTLRRPSADPERLLLAIAPRLERVPAPAVALALEVAAFGPPAADQRGLVDDPAAARRGRLRDAVRQVRQAAGDDAVMHVLEVDPVSRWPERRAVLAPWTSAR